MGSDREAMGGSGVSRSDDDKVAAAPVDSIVPSGAFDGRLTLPDVSDVDGSGWGGARFTVLAVGNPIMGDDGIGLEILAGLQDMVATHPTWQAAQDSGELVLLEGGTGGMELVPVVQESEHLLILDSVAAGNGRTPGQALHLSGDHVPRLLSMKMSPHQVGLLDILTSARLTGKEPQVLEVIGVVSEDVDLRVGLTPAAAAGIPRAVEFAAEILDSWLG